MVSVNQIVTIDGPSGVGKSTVSRKVAGILGFTYLDTGAMYRSVGLYLVNKGISFADEQLISQRLLDIDLQLFPSVDTDVQVKLNGEDVSRAIRSPEMSMVASKVSALGVVRKFLTEQQRKYGVQGRIVAEGRDMGTVVFPSAAWKFYLDARPEVRAQRRCDQLWAKGEDADFKDILQQTNERDKNDSERNLAPLCKADDAMMIDTSDIAIEKVVQKILQQVNI